MPASRIENLVFRLNHDENLNRRTGSELTSSCSKFSKLSPEDISDTLKFFISELKTKKGIEKNLLFARKNQNLLQIPQKSKGFLRKKSGRKMPQPRRAGLRQKSVHQQKIRKKRVCRLKHGAGGRDRTCDLNLMKILL